MKNLSALFAVVAASAVLHGMAHAQYPQKPIKIIPNSAAATGPDIIARLFAAKVGNNMGQPVVVENRPGSNGNIAGELVVRPSVPAKTVAEFIAYAKTANPPMFYGSAGNGSQHHLAMELFKQRTGINLTHIPYTGGGAATATALLAGDISATIGGSAVSVQVKAGKLRSLATTAATRSPDAPDLPTIAETLPGYEILTWVGLFAATGTSTDALSRLRGEMSRFLVQQDVIDKLNSAGGFLPWNVSVDEFQTAIKRDYNRYGEIVKAVGVRVD